MSVQTIHVALNDTTLPVGGDPSGRRHASISTQAERYTARKRTSWHTDEYEPPGECAELPVSARYGDDIVIEEDHVVRQADLT